MSNKTIALDAMGGDFGPKVVIPAALKILRQHSDLDMILVGDQPTLEKMLRRLHADKEPRLRIHHTTEVVEMDESPSQALRGKKDSSMRVAINLVHQGEAQACVSAGNTGALMATAKFVLKTLPGVHRPAIITRFPAAHGKEVRVLDLGANVDSSAEQLFQFAVMGSSLTAAVDNNPAPKVCLLNVGEEEIKGNEVVKQADQLLSECADLNYQGYIEADAIFHGEVDVVVCDGFVGNIMLKGIEGVLKFIGRIVKKKCKQGVYAKFASLMFYPILKRVQKRVDPRRYNGATLIGLNGIVVKSHGSAEVVSYATAIHEALLEIDKNVPQQIGEQVAKLLVEGAE